MTISSSVASLAVLNYSSSSTNTYLLVTFGSTVRGSGAGSAFTQQSMTATSYASGEWRESSRGRGLGPDVQQQHIPIFVHNTTAACITARETGLCEERSQNGEPEVAGASLRLPCPSGPGGYRAGPSDTDARHRSMPGQPMQMCAKYDGHEVIESDVRAAFQG